MTLAAMAEMKKAEAEQMDAQTKMIGAQTDQFNAETKRIDVLSRANKNGFEIENIQADTRKKSIDGAMSLRKAIVGG